MTAVANSAFTAAQFNTHVRDNLLESAPAKATTAGRIFVATGVNSIAERAISKAVIVTSETTTSQSGTDLATVGPQVTITTGTSAIVLFAAQMSNNGAGGQCLMDYAISGASTRASSDDTAARHTSSNANEQTRAASFDFPTGLTAGSNTFTPKYWVSGNTGTFLRRLLLVIAL